jgi:hypothetical protein
VIKSLALRNAISALLLAVVIAGIVAKVGEIRHGIVDSTTRLTLAAYVLIALYAIASIGVRVNAARNKRSAK